MGKENQREEYKKEMDKRMLQHHGQYDIWEPTGTNLEQHNFLEEDMYMDQYTPTVMKPTYQPRDLPQEPEKTYLMTENNLETRNENTNQFKNRVIHNSRYQKQNQTQRPSNPGRNHTDERFQRPPPNLEVDNIIGQLNKVGFNQNNRTQEKLHEEQTNRKAMKDMQEAYIEKEKNQQTKPRDNIQG